jgi:hypothetical protein
MLAWLSDFPVTGFPVTESCFQMVWNLLVSMHADSTTILKHESNARDYLSRKTGTCFGPFQLSGVSSIPAAQEE